MARKSSTKKQPPKLLESHAQRGFIKFCRSHPDPRIYMTFSIHNSGRKAPITYGKDIAEGLLAGVADVCVPYPTNLHHALFLEFKSPTGKQSEKQKKFEIFCIKYNYEYKITRSTNDAINVLTTYINSKR